MAAIFLLVGTVYSGFDGERTTHATLLRVNGRWVIVPVMFPVLVALVVRVDCGESGYSIRSDFARLQSWQSSSILRSVLLPPRDRGTMWSNSSRSRAPHLAHRP